ncbi:MAG: ATP12 family protein [Roseitalea porphyridii]
MKRFYSQASVVTAADGHAVTLDGRPMKTPARRPFRLPSRGLADAVAAEWNRQGEKLDLPSMPLTQFANTAIDRLPESRAGVVDQIMRYADTDLLCYRAKGPDILVVRQARAWDPPLDWLGKTYGVVLVPTIGIVHLPQSPEALERLRQIVCAFDDWRLGMVGHLTGVTGSVVLALSLAQGAMPVDAVIAASFVDEDYQAERWGEDLEAARRRALTVADIEAAARFLRALRTD